MRLLIPPPLLLLSWSRSPRQPHSRQKNMNTSFIAWLQTHTKETSNFFAGHELNKEEDDDEDSGGWCSFAWWQCIGSVFLWGSPRQCYYFVNDPHWDYSISTA